MSAIVGNVQHQLRMIADTNLNVFRDTINTWIKAGWFVIAEPRPYFENGTYVAFVTDDGTGAAPPDIPMEMIDPRKHLGGR